MSTGFIAACAGTAAVCLGLRSLMRNRKLHQELLSGVSKFTSSYVVEGGFEPKMTRGEASRILGVPSSARPQRVKEAHKKLIVINHPDRGGSPYLASKINEAKELMESTKN